MCHLISTIIFTMRGWRNDIILSLIPFLSLVYVHLLVEVGEEVVLLQGVGVVNVLVEEYLFVPEVINSHDFGIPLFWLSLSVHIM